MDLSDPIIAGGVGMHVSWPVFLASAVALVGLGVLKWWFINR